MKFTLVTSFYNGEQFIHQLYDKIKQQTYKNWEWIVTDDFSNDNGRDILLEISSNDRRVKYINQTQKKEMFWNPQKFCKNSNVIVQLDQDDYPLPKALEVYHYFFTKFPEVILITCSGNMYNENGSWRSFYNLDFRNDNNMSCGKLTFLRAWRNNPNINFDFNPGNWMEYFFNDLSIVCGLEEFGKVLNLPRNLYYYNYREESISHKMRPDFYKIEDENTKLMSNINNRRVDKNFDTISRYFDPIYDITHSFMSHDFNNTQEQIKLSYYVKDISTYQKNLLKDLFFDFDININQIDGDEDFLIYTIESLEDFNIFHENEKKNSIRNTQLIIQNFYDQPSDKTDEILNHIKRYYPVAWQIDVHMILTLLR